MPGTGVKPHFIIDTMFGNTPVASFEVPTDWRVSSGLQWVFGQVVDPANDFAYPVNMWARAEDPNGDAALERFPEMNFYFVPQAMFSGGLGGLFSNLMGQAAQQNRLCGATSSPPMAGAEAVVKFLLPRCRAGLPDLRVVGQFDPREYAALVPSNPATHPEPVGLRIEYSAHGKQYEEEIYAIKTQWDVQNYGGMGMMVQTNWQISMSAGLRAVKGTLAQRRPELMRILASARPNPKWVAFYSHMLQQLQQSFDAYIQQGYDAIAAAGAVSRQISANNDAMLGQFEQHRQAERAQWDQARRNAAQQEERSVADQFSDYIRGVNTYEDPQGGHVQHSNDDSILWKSSNGRYLGSSDPSFDPNVGSTESWEKLRRLG
jgi:hypothetical protein